MKPREFCSEPGYDAFLCLTYNADLGFFESVVLPQLWAGGTGEALLIADERSLEESIPRQGARLRHLGRRYALDAPRGWGRQHAKVLLRLGKAGALLWVGSGNLSSGGWGGNRELATAWRVESGDAVGMRDVQRVLRVAHGLSQGRVHESLGRWREGNAFAASEGEGRVLISGPGAGTLATQLSARLSGRRFRRARMLTGSTDDKGALLRWLHETFGVEEATVAVDPLMSDFDPEALISLPLSVNIVPLPSKPRSHAKLLVLDGPGGSVAVMGSANCSAAAWLSPAKSGGNIEAVVVYDEATDEGLVDCLKSFSVMGVPPSQAGLPGKPAHVEQIEDNESVFLVELTLDDLRGEVRARIAPAQPEVVAAELVVGDLRCPVRAADSDGSWWVGPLPDLPASGGTQLGRLLLTKADGQVLSSARWIDVGEELDRWRTRRGAAALSDLSRRPARRSDYARIREEVAELAAAILSGREGSIEPPAVRRVATAPTEVVEPADPDQLLRTLSSATNLADRYAEVRSGGLAFSGIWQAVFLGAGQDEGQREMELVDEDQQAETAGVASPDTSRSPPPPTDAPPEEQSKRFIEFMTGYFEELGGPKFMSKMTARSLVDAVAFALAVAARSSRGGWVNAPTARGWVMRAEELLLQVDTGDTDTSTGGLLEVARRRYAAAGNLDTFEQVVGDGMLWAALSGALLQVAGQEPELERALALREVFDEPMLVRRAQPQRLARLVGVADGADHLRLLERAQEAAHAVRALEVALREEASSLLAAQSGGTAEQGDLVWHPSLGFGRVQQRVKLEPSAKLLVHLRRRRNPGKVIARHLVIVQSATKTSARIARCLALAESCSLAP